MLQKTDLGSSLCSSVVGLGDKAFMSLRSSIATIVGKFPQGVCDACIQDIAGAKTHQDVNMACRALEGDGVLARSKRRSEDCVNCDKHRVLNKPTAPSQSQGQPTQPNGTPDLAAKLDSVRRLVIQMLNKIDPASGQEPFSKRVTYLRNKNLLPQVQASLILTLATFRNAMIYTNFKPDNDEMSIINAISSALTNFCHASLK